MLEDERYRAAAQRLAAAIAGETAEDRAAAELEQLVSLSDGVQDSGAWRPTPL